MDDYDGNDVRVYERMWTGRLKTILKKNDIEYARDLLVNLIIALTNPYFFRIA